MVHEGKNKNAEFAQIPNLNGHIASVHKKEVIQI